MSIGYLLLNLIFMKIISLALVVALVSLTGKTELVSQVLVTFVTLPGEAGLVAQDVGLALKI